MTTAHKPTFHPAIAKKNEGGWDSAGAVSHQFSVRDMPQQLTLKTRKLGQGSQSELQSRTAEDLKRQLEEKERKHYVDKKAKSKGGGAGAGSSSALLQLTDGKSKGGGGDVVVEDSVLKVIEDKFDDSDEFESSSDDSDSDSGDDDDEQAFLMAEVARIKKEREEEARRKEKERMEAEQADKDAGMRAGNPLLQGQSSGTGSSGPMKKKWRDDVVFKNQARDAPVLKKRYINDTVRNDFHRKFMARYIQ